MRTKDKAVSSRETGKIGQDAETGFHIDGRFIFSQLCLIHVSNRAAGKPSRSFER